MTDLPTLAGQFYAWDALTYVFGSSYHPGGLDLTGRLAGLMRVPRGARVLDVACGPGASARYLAERFGWSVVGIDVNPIAAFRARVVARGYDTAFFAGEATRLPFRAHAFDAAICECSLCLFGDETEAMREVVRTMNPGARIGLSDVTLAANAPLSDALRGALAAVACLATAKPVDRYREILEAAGVRVDRVENASWAMANMLDSLRDLAQRAMGVGLAGVRVGRYTIQEIADLLDEARDLYRDGYLGYAVLVGTVRP
ncbi:MAG: methyltransferase domain-containing protein [Euryarchaeota archaeon]|nr:methyltransferase domain-containing protein [Euryarchaeota archaeon]